MDHRKFILRFLEAIANLKERICIQESEKFPDGRFEILPSTTRSEAYFEAMSDYTSISFNSSPAPIIRVLDSPEDEKTICSISALESGVYIRTHSGHKIDLKWDQIEYDESMGFITRRPIEAMGRKTVERLRTFTEGLEIVGGDINKTAAKVVTVNGEDVRNVRGEMIIKFPDPSELSKKGF